jgi:D-alanyl-D-alanine carboxypeptidase
VVLDNNTKEVLFGKLEKDRREVASLTKIMTIYTVLNLVDKLGIGLDFGIVIEESVNNVIGTSALL